MASGRLVKERVLGRVMGRVGGRVWERVRERVGGRVWVSVRDLGYQRNQGVGAARNHVADLLERR